MTEGFWRICEILSDMHLNRMSLKMTYILPACKLQKPGISSVFGVLNQLALCLISDVLYK